MAYRIGVKPGKPASAAGLVVGVLFVMLGLAVIPPLFGPFGLLWTVVAAVIALCHGYNLFSRRGAPAYEVDVEPGAAPEDFETKLRKLARLKEDGLIHEAEYEQKRAELLRQRW